MADPSTPPDPNARRVIAVSVALTMDGISRMLVRDASGWRFYSWTKESGATTGIDPFPADRDRYFDPPDAATAYFAQKCGSRLRERSDSPRQIHPLSPKTTPYRSSTGRAEGTG